LISGETGRRGHCPAFKRTDSMNIGRFLRKSAFGACGILLLTGSVWLISFARSLRSPVEKSVQVPAGDSKIQGKANAPVQIVEYSDFECVACGALQPDLKKVLETYPDKVSLVFHHFVIRSHVRSPLAHEAAECACEQGKFWGYYDLLYQYQDLWSQAADYTEELLNFARDLDLDLPKFVACLGSPTVIDKIKQDTVSGEQLGIKSTPTLFINGRMFVGKKQFEEEGMEFIRKELAKSDDNAAK